MNWKDYAAEFNFNGSWLDIYVLETGFDDWQQLLDFVGSNNYSYRFTINGESAPVPPARSIFERRRFENFFLEVKTAAATLNCNFFTPEEIEFDFDPREVLGEKEAETIFSFMRDLANLLKKDVILTPENMSDYPIFRFAHETSELLYLHSTE